MGVAPYWVYRLVKRLRVKDGISQLGLMLAGIAGSLVNTLLVMNLIFLFFRDAYAAANQVASTAVYGFILGIIGINGIPEAIVAAVLTWLVCRVLMNRKVMQNIGV